MRTAKLAGANLPIRKTTIVDLNILDTYLETQAKIKEKEEIDKEEAEEMILLLIHRWLWYCLDRELLSQWLGKIQIS